MDELVALTEQEAKIVDNATSKIIDTSIFRSSKQCQLLLRYIVDQSLAHQDDLLRERIIGAAVFGRAPDYDTGNDPVVRARVAEIRKRLAQYYLQYPDETSVQISIPSGSYRAIFHFNSRISAEEALAHPVDQIPADETQTLPNVSEAETPVAAPSVPVSNSQDDRRDAKSWIKWAALILLFVAFSGFALRYWTQYEQMHRFTSFWAPICRNQKPPLIYIGASPSFHLSPAYIDNYRQQHADRITGPATYVDLQPGESLSAKDLIPFNSSIGFGDVAATARVASVLNGFGQTYDLRYGGDISVTDMRTAPVVLIGGYSNYWTLQATHDLRYTLEYGDRIVDHQDKSKMWQRNNDPRAATQNDYAVLTRLVNPASGNVILIIAGVGSSGNQAAADFVSDPQRIDKLLKSAPANWEKMNMQIVLRTETVNGVPSPADIQAVYFW